MNKLQQEIIEIIEPYMDKTLSEGCLVKFPLQQILGDYVEVIVPLIEILPKDNNWEYFTYLHPNKIILKECLSVNGEIQSGIEIIGHYDTTAVLKYMEDNTFHEMFMHEDIIIFENNIGIGRFEIPNKPLHLYTEEENKDLLELLKELGTKN